MKGAIYLYIRQQKVQWICSELLVILSQEQTTEYPGWLNRTLSLAVFVGIETKEQQYNFCDDLIRKRVA